MTPLYEASRVFFAVFGLQAEAFSLIKIIKKVSRREEEAKDRFLIVEWHATGGRIEAKISLPTMQASLIDV